MRAHDELLEIVRKAVIINNTNGLHIYLEIYDTWVNKVVDSYTDDRMNIELISKDYPQFFKTNK
jgi:hypothetical protein